MLNLKSVFVKCTQLYDVFGRVYYISSPEKQEFLVANYSTVDSDYWSRLHNCFSCDRNNRYGCDSIIKEERKQ